MADQEDKEALKSLERDKERMIRVYMSLQDKADGINEEIYNTCCDIEALNVRIAELQARLGLPGAAKPSNGKALPASARKGAGREGPAVGKGKTTSPPAEASSE